MAVRLCWRAIKVALRRYVNLPFIVLRRAMSTMSTAAAGHQHLPTQEQLHSGDDWRARLMIVLSMGMRPCSGAINGAVIQ
ncbi:hypothetical protein KCP71_13470 [Salmonella enterica subsp. enterica]|nr:hypothetical protein KCP71_13470 [Salmonella enterica subsp. enterica]